MWKKGFIVETIGNPKEYIQPKTRDDRRQGRDWYTGPFETAKVWRQYPAAKSVAFRLKMVIRVIEYNDGS